MQLNEKLVSLRKEKGLTQLKVAEELDISRQAISRWESGVAMPSTENLRCLSELYSVPVDYLINEELDLPKEENRVPAEQIAKNVEKTKKKVSKQVIVVVCILLVAAIVLVCIVTRPNPNMGATPIGEMKVEDDNQSASDGEFSIGW